MIVPQDVPRTRVPATRPRPWPAVSEVDPHATDRCGRQSPGHRDPTAARALALNLDESIYGSFSEIGAGQEVARWFFAAGGAAGTVAKSISAYDMTVSDAIYGRT